jgi:secreted Zn-dependent insulinase-like peptidase
MQREAWYGTRYSARPLPPDWLREWREGTSPPQLHLPRQNPFIPQRFDLLEVRMCCGGGGVGACLVVVVVLCAAVVVVYYHCDHHQHNTPPPPFLPQESAPQPSLVHASPMVRLWHRPDPSFRVPKAVLHMHLQLAGGWEASRQWV